MSEARELERDAHQQHEAYPLSTMSGSENRTSQVAIAIALSVTRGLPTEPSLPHSIIEYANVSLSITRAGVTVFPLTEQARPTHLDVQAPSRTSGRLTVLLAETWTSVGVGAGHPPTVFLDPSPPLREAHMGHLVEEILQQYRSSPDTSSLSTLPGAGRQKREELEFCGGRTDQIPTR